MKNEDRITLEGTIYFDPNDKTKKHKSQSSWKKIALIMFNSDLAEYYGWFLQRRYNLVLNKPLRGAHISFINDRGSDMNGNWEKVKKKWHKKKIKVTLYLDPHFSTEGHWWLIIPHTDRDEIYGIRAELGLDKPYYGLHMSIGHVNEKNYHHHTYITNGIKNGFIT